MITGVYVGEIKLYPTQATKDDIHYLDASTKLVFIVSVPCDAVRSSPMEKLQVMAEENLHSFVKRKKPKNLFRLDFEGTSYDDLAILNCVKRANNFFLMLESLTFCKIGVVEDVKRQIAKDFGTGMALLGVSHAN
jgi:hypothetical protein